MPAIIGNKMRVELFLICLKIFLHPRAKIFFMLSYMLSQYARLLQLSYSTFMVKTMVVRAGIEVYRQKFLGDFLGEKLDYVRNIFTTKTQN